MPVILTDAEYNKLLRRSSPNASSKTSPNASSKASPKRFKRCPPGKQRNPETNRCKKSVEIKKRDVSGVSKATLESAREKVLQRRCKTRERTSNPDKPKRELNVYQQFMKDTIAILKKTYPDDSAKMRFSTAVQMWREHKKDTE
jgi:hypothetical protein